MGPGLAARSTALVCFESFAGFFTLSVITLLIAPGPITLLVACAGLVGGMRHAFATICGTNLASLVPIFLSALLIKGLLLAMGVAGLGYGLYDLLA
jgi:threonine/homoserine/homoserine lactone efflux protein